MLNSRAGKANQKCPGCNEITSCRHREFSAQTWSLLIEWQEVDEDAVGKPMCSECYRDLREVLIERVDQQEESVSQPVVQKERSVPGSVRKAG